MDQAGQQAIALQRPQLVDFSTIVLTVVVFMEFGYSLQKKRAGLPWMVPEKEDGVMDRTTLQLPLETLLLGIMRLVWKLLKEVPSDLKI